MKECKIIKISVWIDVSQDKITELLNQGFEIRSSAMNNDDLYIILDREVPKPRPESR